MNSALIESIARETARMGNSRAWAEILTRLTAAGLSPGKAHAARQATWRVRKRNAGAAQQAGKTRMVS